MSGYSYVLDNPPSNFDPDGNLVLFHSTAAKSVTFQRALDLHLRNTIGRTQIEAMDRDTRNSFIFAVGKIEFASGESVVEKGPEKYTEESRYRSFSDELRGEFQISPESFGGMNAGMKIIYLIFDRESLDSWPDDENARTIWEEAMHASEGSGSGEADHEKWGLTSDWVYNRKLKQRILLGGRVDLHSNSVGAKYVRAQAAVRAKRSNAQAPYTYNPFTGEEIDLQLITEKSK